MSAQTSSPELDWSRSEAIAWMVRSIHNRAIGIYMGETTETQYDAIYEVLSDALSDLERLVPEENGWECRPGWCPDDRDRCVPCEENGDGPLEHRS